MQGGNESGKVPARVSGSLGELRRALWESARAEVETDLRCAVLLAAELSYNEIEEQLGLWHGEIREARARIERAGAALW
jgi:hypothetical protein